MNEIWRKQQGTLKYYLNFIQPSETYRESFNMFNEVLMLFLPFNLYDERIMDYLDKLLMIFRENKRSYILINWLNEDR
ncbi:hypothetical protein [Clostridium saccharoperbutylacetonicum]